MPYDPDRHHRRSIRLRGYDYARSGAYFVTICVQGRLYLFGNADAGHFRPDAAGEMIGDWWERLPGKFPTASLDAFVVMPNHIHGIVLLDAGAAGDAVEADPGVRPQRIPTLSTVVQWFKTMTTNAYIQGVRDQAWLPFDRRLWQRNFYEHIVRSEDDMERVRAYIADNPAQWRLDQLYAG